MFEIRVFLMEVKFLQALVKFNCRLATVTSHTEGLWVWGPLGKEDI
jgi:hypothetical protein